MTLNLSETTQTVFAGKRNRVFHIVPVNEEHEERVANHLQAERLQMYAGFFSAKRTHRVRKSQERQRGVKCKK